MSSPPDHVHTGHEWRDLKPLKMVKKKYPRRRGLSLYPTKWLHEAICWVMQQEEERLCEEQDMNNTTLGLIQLGIDRYRELNCLPENRR